jgi:hypothetical protein
MTDSATDWLAQYQAEMKQRREKLAPAKAVLLDALKASGIAVVTVEYDGEGDSGQVNNIVACDASCNPAEMRGSVVLELGLRPCSYESLVEAVEAFTWEVLVLYHDGFENNDGGFGTVTIYVVTGKVTLDHNDRVIEAVNTMTEV